MIKVTAPFIRVSLDFEGKVEADIAAVLFSPSGEALQGLFGLVYAGNAVHYTDTIAHGAQLGVPKGDNDREVIDIILAHVPEDIAEIRIIAFVKGKGTFKSVSKESLVITDITNGKVFASHKVNFGDMEAITLGALQRGESGWSWTPYFEPANEHFTKMVKYK